MALFNYDNRNLGGKTIITKHFINHKKALQAIKPILNTMVPPRAHVRQGCSQIYGNNNKHTLRYMQTP